MSKAGKTGMTKILTGESSVAMSNSAFLHLRMLFLAASILMPKFSSPQVDIYLMVGPISPTPAVKTMASTLPRRAAYAPIYLRILWHSISIPSFALSFPSAAAFSTSRLSLMPQIPRSPLFLLSAVSISLAVMPVLFMM